MYNFDISELEEAVKDSMFGLGGLGFCTECGADRDGVEPDAEGYECYDCGQHAVMGCELLYITLA